MADEVLSVGITADVAQFLSGMQKVQTGVDSTVESLKGFGDKVDHVTKIIESDWNAALAENLQHMRGVREEVKESTGVIDQLRESLGEVASGFALATLATSALEKAVDVVKEFVTESIKAASDAEMVGVKFTNAFGGSANEVKEWAEKTGGALGRSSDDMQKVATSARIMLGGLGVGSHEADEMSKSLGELAVNMSIAQGIPLEDAMQRLNAGMHGAGRGLYEFGIAINSTTQNQEAMRLGLGDTYSKLTQAQQTQVNFNLAMQGAKQASADAAVAMGTYSNSVASLSSNIEEARAKVGSSFTPALKDLAVTVNSLAAGFNHLSDNTREWIAAIVTAPIGGLNAKLSGVGESIGNKMAGYDPDAAQQGAVDHSAKVKADAEVQRQVAERNAESAQKQADLAKKAADDAKEEAKIRAEAWKKVVEAAHRAIDESIKAAYQDQEERVKTEIKLADLRMKGVEAEASAQLSADNDRIAAAKAGITRADSGLSEAKSGGGSISDAIAAVDHAYVVAQTAAENAINDISAQIEANNKITEYPGLYLAEDVEKAKAKNIALQKELGKDESDLEGLKQKGLMLEQQHHRDEVNFYKGLGSGLSNSALGGLGSSVVSGGMSGAAFGPAGIAAGAGAALLQNSAGMKAMGDAVSGVLQKVADTLGKVFEPLVPVINQIGDAIGPLLKALGDVFGAAGKNLAAAIRPLIPVIEMASEFVGQLLEPVSKMLDAIRPLIPMLVEFTEITLAISLIGFAPLIASLKILEPVFSKVAQLMRWIGEQLAGVWNGIITFLVQVFEKLGHILPGGLGDIASDFAGDIASMAIQIGGLDDATVGATASVSQFAQALQQANATRFGDQSNIAAIQNALAMAQQNGNAALADKLSQELKQAQQQYGVDLIKAMIAEAQSQGGTLHQTTGAGSSYNGQSVAQLQADLAYAEAENSITTNANTKATRDLIATLTNTPTGFRIGGYEYGAQGGGGGVIITGPVTVNNTGDAATLTKSIQKAAAKSSGVGMVHWA